MPNANWNSFNALMDGKDALNELDYQKKKQPKPVLSEDQLYNIEKCILSSFNEQKEVIISYYNNGFLSNISGIITKVDPIMKKIYINKQKSLYFLNIIEIYEKNT